MPEVRYYAARPGRPGAYLVTFHDECAGEEAYLSAVVSRWDETDDSSYWFCVRHLTAWRPEGLVPVPCVCMGAVEKYRHDAHID